MICRPCLIASYLEDESFIEWYGEDAKDSIKALAEMWHDKCTGCDCEVKKREGRLLLRLRALRGVVCTYLHVPELHR